MLGRWERLSILSVIVIPASCLIVAIAGRSTFWFGSQSFYSAAPGYLASALALEALQLLAVFVAGRFLRIGPPAGPKTLWWGGYQLVCGFVLFHAFGDIDLWLGSTVLVYVGVGAIFSVAITRALRAGG